MKGMRWWVVVMFISLLSMSGCATRNGRSENPDIVLITIDTLRADHLYCYGYERSTSPTIDSIAAKGIIFKNTISPSSWTAPSMVSLFTSVYPSNHGVVHGMGYRKNKEVHPQEVFSDELVTLVEILKDQGYNTFGVASNFHLSEKFGFARGFDHFQCLPFLAAPSVNEILYFWEDEIKKSDKSFMWLHYIDPHLPYLPRTPWIEQYTSKTTAEELSEPETWWGFNQPSATTFDGDSRTLSTRIALYDSEINYVDSFVGKLIDEFEFDENTLIIITSDHGEEFLEHGQLGHGNNLYQETLHVPLIVKLPNSSRKGVIHRQVNLVDIMPTILHILNVDPPEQMLGQSLFKAEGFWSWLKKLFMEKSVTDYKLAELDTDASMKTIMNSQWKYIYDYKENSEQLYNIISDRSEVNNLTDKEITKKKHLKTLLFEWTSDVKKYPTREQRFRLSSKEKEMLKGLGYIQ